jgi:hypothetical protein
VQLKSKWDVSSQEEKKGAVKSLLVDLQVRGLLTLLRVRKTKGSMDHFPPSVKQMLASFNSLHSPIKPLSVGARALSKHYLRSVDGWWGDNKVNRWILYDR